MLQKMQIPSTNTTTDFVVTNSPRLANLISGNTVEVTVKSITPNGITQLQLGDRIIEARTALPLQPGQKLNLQILNAGQKITLKLLHPSYQKSDQTANALKKLLPQQAPLTVLLNNLKLTKPLSGQHTSDTTLTKQLTTFMSQFPTHKQITTPSGLKQAIENSGIFLEKKLASNNTTALAKDFKANLLLLKSFISTLNKASIPQITKNKPLSTHTQKTTTPHQLTPHTSTPITDTPLKEPPTQEATNKTTQQLLNLLRTTSTSSTAQKHQLKQLTHLLKKHNLTQRAEINQWLTKNTLSQRISHQENSKLQDLLSITASSEHSPNTAKGHAKTLIQNLLPALKSASRQQIQTSLLLLKPLLMQSGLFSDSETVIISQLEKTQTDTLHPYLQRLLKQLLTQTAPSKMPHLSSQYPPSAPPRPTLEKPRNKTDAERLPPPDELKLQLIKQVDSAIARITTMQLNQLTENDNDTGWRLEIPISNEQDLEVLTLTIDREKSGNQETADFLWKMGLTFNFKKMGNTHARIMLSGEKASVTFWSEQQETATLIQNNLDLLEAGLKLTGLTVGTLSCKMGPPPPTKSKDTTQGTLLNEKA